MAHTLQISITFDKVPFWCEKNLPETKNRSLLQWKEVTGALLKSTVFIACSENDIVVWTAKFGRFIIDFIIMECPIQELVSKGEEREYHQITASKSWIIFIYCIIFSVESDLYLFLDRKRGHFIHEIKTKGYDVIGVNLFLPKLMRFHRILFMRSIQ